MLPAAPPRLSITICCLSASDSCGLNMGESTSAPPPGGHGTIQRMGLAGYPWACATPAASRAASSTRRNFMTFTAPLLLLNDLLGAQKFEYVQKHLCAVHRPGDAVAARLGSVG